MDSGSELARVRADPQTILDMDSLDDQNFVLDLDFSRDFRGEIALGQLNAARLQRASQGAGQSPAGCGDDIVESRGARWKPLGIDAVVFGDLGMDAEESRFFLGGEIGPADRTPDPFDSNSGGVNDA
jgi:hypothetical protein